MRINSKSILLKNPKELSELLGIEVLAALGAVEISEFYKRGLVVKSNPNDYIAIMGRDEKEVIKDLKERYGLIVIHVIDSYYNLNSDVFIPEEAMDSIGLQLYLCIPENICKKIGFNHLELTENEIMKGIADEYNRIFKQAKDGSILAYVVSQKIEATGFREVTVTGYELGLIEF
ncbi:hypothetical protein G9F72_019285 [Clostridium estertheticum]|uniref:hypothetical protein n=1 Tax=Clostridium estertheticum TaxID=238834 RepID=UPI0013E9791C|nr:hypothetical protein [Clostridium estertheticum]MBZ9688477.1 hypothetical protein [Clostridium estertheticum]